MFDAFVNIVSREPVLFLWMEETQTAALEKFHQVFDGAFRKWALACVALEMTVATSVHSFVRGHSQA